MLINSSILPTPTIELANGKSQPCSDNTLRNLAIQKPSDALAYRKWAVVYERKHYAQANSMFQALQQASVKIGLNVEEPSWIEIERSDDTYTCAEHLHALIENKTKPSIVLVMLGNERLYKNFKSICYQNQLVS